MKENNIYLLGYDIGTSAIKGTLLNAKTGKVVASATSPSDKEREIIVNGKGFAEQDPKIWFQDVCSVTSEIRNQIQENLHNVKAIGIAYQMHGLVCVDNEQKVLRPSIIWCDGRAVEIGNDAFNDIGKKKCLSHLLNSPGNFTASKLKWVKENEPELYSKIDKIMLPGNYIAMKLTGKINTTPSGLSEGIMWDFKNEKIASFLLDYYGISEKLIPEIIPVFSNINKVSINGCMITSGLTPVTKVSYMAGDQPNNALSLNVLEPGEIAATAGTSGVIYGVTDKQEYDPLSRVNTFLHVNHSKENPRYGVLSCVNGAGKLYSKVQKEILNNMPYGKMDKIANESSIGSNGVVILPYINGPERTLGNKDIGNLIDLNVLKGKNPSDISRAALESVAFALFYSFDALNHAGVEVGKIKAGNANMFKSDIFCETLATLSGASIELYSTDGSQGAARGAGIGAGIYKNPKDAFIGLDVIKTIKPCYDRIRDYKKAYGKWRTNLDLVLKKTN